MLEDLNASYWSDQVWDAVTRETCFSNSVQQLVLHCPVHIITTLGSTFPPTIMLSTPIYLSQPPQRPPVSLLSRWRTLRFDPPVTPVTPVTVTPVTGHLTFPICRTSRPWCVCLYAPGHIKVTHFRRIGNTLLVAGFLMTK